MSRPALHLPSPSLTPMEATRARICVCFAVMAVLLGGCAPRPSAEEAQLTAQPATAEAGGPNTLSPQERAEGWVLLFDGRTLDGWRQGSDVDWTVTGGVIRATAGEVGLLFSEETFGDVELMVEFRAAPGTNSGVFLRSPPGCRDPSRDCYEVNIAPPEHPFPTGSLVGRARAEGGGERRDWRRFLLRAAGDRIAVSLDGEELVDYRDPEPLPPGPVGLQYNRGRIEFRGVKARSLSR